MKRSWNKRRTTVARTDAQRRWDRAYQLLIEWSSCQSPTAIAEQCHNEENNNENSNLCASINSDTITTTEH